MADTAAKQTVKPRRGNMPLLGIILLAATLLAAGGFIALLARPNVDPGIRAWVLNHTPDQLVIINPFNGAIEKELQVADGLKQLAFSRDFTKAYIINVVDVSNRITVLDTRTFLPEETIEIDGVPQGIGVFPDNEKLVLINASKTDFMSGGFDVINLYEQSRANPRQKKRLYRERTRELVNHLAVGDDGDRIYVTDSKSSNMFIYSLKEKAQTKTFDMHGAIEELYYPRQGKYYYVTVLQHLCAYQFDKATDEMTGAYTYSFIVPGSPFNPNKIRKIAVDATGDFLIAPMYESGAVAVWHVGDPAYWVDWSEVPTDMSPDSSMYRFEVPHYLPCKRFKLKGGYDPTIKYIPGGKFVQVDSQNDGLFIMDEDGALYIYDMRELDVFDETKRDPVSSEAPKRDNLPVPEPRQLITELSNRVTEIRDLQISRPAILNFEAVAEEQP